LPPKKERAQRNAGGKKKEKRKAVPLTIRKKSSISYTRK